MAIYSATKGPLRDERGEIIGLLGISRDITALKQTQHQLAERVKELNCLRQVASILYAAGDELEKMLPSALAELPRAWLYPELAAACLRLRNEKYQTSNYRSTPWRLSAPLSEPEEELELVYLEERAFLAEEIELIATLGEMFADAIKRQRTERALRLSEERLRESRRMDALGKMAGGVAHDYNNMLTAIGGTAELLLEELAPGDSSMRQDLTSILHEVHRATDLTSQLLAFSRQQPVQARPVSVGQALRDSERMLGRLIGEDKVLFISAPRNEDAILIDPGQLHQLIVNLVVNARDAMPNGGTIRLQSEPVRLEDAIEASGQQVPAGHYLRLIVEDEGTGIADDILPYIFEPFFTTKDQGKGTGLGLATVYGIVKQHGGHLFVQSVLGQGTRMEVYFLAQGQKVLPHLEEQLPEVFSTATETVLIVEDESSVLKMMARTLSRKGYRVLESGSAKEALETAERNCGMDLMITDVVMPEMNGRELAEKFAEHWPETPILFMSGYTEDEVMKRGIRDGEVFFLAKPFTSEALISKIREILQKR